MKANIKSVVKMILFLFELGVKCCPVVSKSCHKLQTLSGLVCVQKGSGHSYRTSTCKVFQWKELLWTKLYQTCLSWVFFGS